MGQAASCGPTLRRLAAPLGWRILIVMVRPEEREVYRVLVGKPDGKRPLGSPRCRWVDNIRMDLQEVGCGYMEWIGLARDRDRWRILVSAVMNLRVPWNGGNFLTDCKPVNFSKKDSAPWSKYEVSKWWSWTIVTKYGSKLSWQAN